MGRVLPILFNTEMVQAILEGRKTVTRRIIKPQPRKEQDHKLGVCIAGDKHDVGKFVFGTNAQGGSLLYVRPPYRPGDIMYIREAYCPDYFDEGLAGYRGDGLRGNRNAYKADYRREIVGDTVPEPRWRPSIHMPKAAARIWLKVTDVRVERLQKMNADDLKAEGFMKHGLDDFEREFDRLAVKFGYEGARNRFASLWDSTIPRGQQDLYGWEANPWVWVIGFERCGKPEEQHVSSDNP